LLIVNPCLFKFSQLLGNPSQLMVGAGLAIAIA
jgi:hypothetical protein